MEKIYQVFVSSTFVDLQEERKEVMQALLELDCMPAGMELFPASNDDQWTLIKRVIDACDYYLLIIGGRYGSTNDEGKSYTQMEFEYALETGKPIISFLPKKPDSIPSGKTEQDADKKQKLEEFKKLAQKKLIKYWETPENLGSIVSRSMIKLIKDFPAEGWVKAGSAVDESSVKEIARLQKENAELKARLNRISMQAPKDSDKLAQGDDPFNIKYSFNLYNEDEDIDFDCERKDSFTWNEIFLNVGPKLLDGCSESEIIERLQAMISKKEYWKRCTKYTDDLELYSISIEQDTIEQILIQLRALGLVTLWQSKASNLGNVKRYWKLTPYGDAKLMSIMAIKKHV